MSPIKKKGSFPAPKKVQIRASRITKDILWDSYTNVQTLAPQTLRQGNQLKGVH